MLKQSAFPSHFSTSPPRSHLKVGKPAQFNENPYQQKLLCGLQTLRVSVVHSSFNDIVNACLKEKIDFDIIHFDWLHLYYQSRNPFTSSLRLLSFIRKWYLLRSKGVRFVWTAHNLSRHDNTIPLLDTLMTTFVARRSDAIIAHCEVAKQKIIQQFNLQNPNKVHVIPHGNYIDCYENIVSASEARADLGISQDTLTLLFMGIIRPNKGIYELIDAFEAINNPKLHLIVAGKPYPHEEEKIATRLKQHSNTTFVPEYVPDDQIQRYVNAADVVVFPYKNILTSGAVILAMSYGRACIVPQLGCMGETINDGLGGFLYDPEKSEGLKEAIERAIEHHFKLAEMGAYNYQKAEQSNWNVVARQTLEVYQSFL